MASQNCVDENVTIEADEKTINEEKLIIKSKIKQIIPMLDALDFECDQLELYKQSLHPRKHDNNDLIFINKNLSHLNINEFNAIADLDSDTPLSDVNSQSKASTSQVIMDDFLDRKSRGNSRKRRTRTRMKKRERIRTESCNSISSGRTSNISSVPTIVSPENYLIYNLLILNLHEREKYLVQIAKERQILIRNKNTNFFDLNPIYQSNIVVEKKEKRRSLSRDNEPITSDLSTPQSNCKSRRDRKRSENFHSSRKHKTYEDQVNYLLYGNDMTNKNKILLKNANVDPTNISFATKPNQENLNNFITKILNENLGTVHDGEIRISAKNSHESYVTTKSSTRDLYISSNILRLGALHGDTVKVFMKNIDNNNSVIGENSTASTDLPKVIGFVISILEKNHPRLCVGTIKIIKKTNDKFLLLLTPRDCKIPIVRLTESGQKLLLRELNGDSKPDSIIYLAKIVDSVNFQPIGKVVRKIGYIGQLAAENRAILLQNGFDPKPFKSDILQSLPPQPFIIPEKEFELREDLRKQCIFTIDPSTAKDLDDAVSCRTLDNGNFEIGVHISDVSYFINENSALDNLIKEQATSIYMVERVYHMLPENLCMICSLLPGEDKLAFSVFWEMTKDGEIINTRFVKSIINSCAKLAYEHAQAFIENPTKDFTIDELPTIYNNFTVLDLKNVVLQLQEIAIKLRQKRFDNGALRIDQAKLCFQLSETGEPISYTTYEQKDSNRLIEEFMLLANGSVAQHTYQKFPEIAILRNHFAPNNINKLQKQLETFGLTFDTSSAKTIRESIEKLINDVEPGKRDATKCILNHLCATKMIRAGYFCSSLTDESDYRSHYALSIPIYTHFTSPIRRYPDILVHRLLTAAIDLSPPPQRKPCDLQKITNNCNIQKYNAKLVGEECSLLYFLYYLKCYGHKYMRAAIINVQNNAIDAILIDTGHQIKINYAIKKDQIRFLFNKDAQPPSLEVCPIRGESYTLTIFSECLVKIFVNDKDKLDAEFIEGFSSKPITVDDLKELNKKNDVDDQDLVVEDIQEDNKKNSSYEVTDIVELEYDDDDDDDNDDDESEEDHE